MTKRGEYIYYMLLRIKGETIKYNEEVTMELFSMLSQVFDGLLYLLLGVGSGGSFPRRLSAEEEREYLDKMSRGDSAARSKLIEHNLRLVAFINKKYMNTAADPEDLISIGTIGLIKAVDTYSPSRGTRLSSYASRCIENAMHTPWKHLFPIRLKTVDGKALCREAALILGLDITLEVAAVKVERYIPESVARLRKGLKRVLKEGTVICLLMNIRTLAEQLVVNLQKHGAGKSVVSIAFLRVWAGEV